MNSYATAAAQSTASPIRVSSSAHRLPEYLQSLSLNAASAVPQLPTFWNPKDKCPLLELSHHCSRVSYTGSGKTDSDAATVRANLPMLPQWGLFYFEVLVVSKGRDGYIGVGFCAGNVPLQRLPGWEQNSWGYHGDDGCVFNGGGSGKAFGPSYTTHDVIGCGVNFHRNEAFFTKNGMLIGTAFRDLKGSMPLFPCVGLRTPGEQLDVNFGQKPFKFDILNYVHDEKDRLLQQIEENYTIDNPISGINTVESMVLKHLLYHGYTESARQLAQDLGLQNDSQFLQFHNDSVKRKSIMDVVRSGEMDRAFDMIRNYYPSLLKQNGDVMFELKCRKFVELVASASDNMEINEDLDYLQAALEYGQNLQDEYRDAPVEKQKALTDIFSLLAYPDPYNSPVGHLLEVSKRDVLADHLNEAMIACPLSDVSCTPVLEKLFRHFCNCISELQRDHSGSSAFIDPFKDSLPK